LSPNTTPNFRKTTSFDIKIKNKKKERALRKVSKMAKRRGGILAVLHRMFCEKLTKFQGSTVEVWTG
jgi:hypothetical protein